MNGIKKEFQNYKIEKRIEISTMSSLIENLTDEFNIKEKNLLISSYIVLAYAYWESCFHKFQGLMFEDFKLVPIESLPFNIKNQISLTLARTSCGKNQKKLISEIANIDIFNAIYRTVHENEKGNVVQILDKFSDRLEEKEMKKHFMIDTVNPNLNRFSEMLKNYGMRLEKIIEVGVKSGKIKSYFSEGLSFIINQRNSIAHKNEKIMYDEVEYSNYDECINKLSLDIEFTPIINGHPELFIYEMTFQIDNFFDLMINEMEKKIIELLE